jgi:HupE / UreJ protein
MRRVWPITVLIAAVLGLGAPSLVAAHQMPTSSVLLDIGSTQVTGELRLPISRLAIAFRHPVTAQTALGSQRTALERYIANHMRVTGKDGQIWIESVKLQQVRSINNVPNLIVAIAFTPRSHHVTAFTLHYGVIIDELVTHRALAVLRSEVHQGAVTHKAQSLGVFQWDRTSVTIQPSGPSMWQAFTEMAGLGINHIREGTDHLLFLLTLLLPAPLIARRHRWVAAPSIGRSVKRIVHVVSAFALGHSLTLAAATVGLVYVPSQPIEVLIAVSIGVSAIHALRPLVPGGEARIAFAFGMVHGLAFAEVLRELGLRGLNLAVSLLGFNLGIEVTQLVVVALVMPSVWLLSTTRFYPGVRITASLFALLAAVLWALQRVALLTSNPLQSVFDALVEHPFVIAGAIAIFAVAVRLVHSLRRTSDGHARPLPLPEGGAT